MRPPTKVPKKIIAMVTENGSAASDFDRSKALVSFCRALEKTLQAYTAPSASCSSTAAPAMNQRPRVGLSVGVAAILAPFGMAPPRLTAPEVRYLRRRLGQCHHGA